MNSPYTTPSSETVISVALNFRKLAVSGTILLVAPLFGAIGTIVGMIRAFSTLEEDGADAKELASDISLALMSTVYGAVFGLIGVVLVSIALFRGFNRELWFLWSVCSLAALWCVLLFPFGLIVGIYLLVIFLKRKSEFTSIEQNTKM